MSARSIFAAIAVAALLASVVRQASADTCDTGMKAFEGSVYAMVRTSCVHCHETGLHGAPKFAVADVATSYARILTFQNFDDIANSYFVQRGGSMHCLTDYGFDCNTHVPDVQKQVQAWWDNGEKNCPRKGKYISPPLALPAALPSPLPDHSQPFATLRWDLGNMNRAFNGSWFEVQVQKFADPSANASGAYRFRSPRLATPTDARIEDIKILVNGSYDSHANEYTTIDRVIGGKALPTDPAAPYPFPLLSTTDVIVVSDAPAPTDLISIGFGDLTPASMPACKATDLFTSKVMPTVTARGCLGCHGAAGNPAQATWDMTGSAVHLCTDFLERVDFTNPAGSTVVSLPFQGALGHPRVIPFADEIMPWFDWIQAEKPSR